MPGAVSKRSAGRCFHRLISAAGRSLSGWPWLPGIPGCRHTSQGVLQPRSGRPVFRCNRLRLLEIYNIEAGRALILSQAKLHLLFALGAESTFSTHNISSGNSAMIDSVAKPTLPNPRSTACSTYQTNNDVYPVATLMYNVKSVAMQPETDNSPDISPGLLYDSSPTYRAARPGGTSQ